MNNLSGGRRNAFLAAAAIALLALAGATLVVMGITGSGGQPVDSASSAPSTVGSTAAERPDTRPTTQRPERGGERIDFGPVLPAAAPVGLSIPSIGVESDTIVRLGIRGDGTLEVPADASKPGWFEPGPSPGQLGPAVIAGHVDDEDGPAVFYRLGDMTPGARIEVGREDGTVAEFVVDRVQTYEKDEFPTRAVYGNTTDRAELRLITCSGEYDEQDGYTSNTVVFAHLVR